ncbi:hypothetical protein BC826DRAFT_565571 [Russula brevipes]|nr:hypothetical protein BC826DRAFT_565571 [Russula brevipes]
MCPTVRPFTILSPCLLTSATPRPPPPSHDTANSDTTLHPVHPSTNYLHTQLLSDTTLGNSKASYRLAHRCTHVHRPSRSEAVPVAVQPWDVVPVCFVMLYKIHVCHSPLLHQNSLHNIFVGRRRECDEPMIAPSSTHAQHCDMPYKTAISQRI